MYIPICLRHDGPLSKSLRFELHFACSQLLFCRTGQFKSGPYQIKLNPTVLVGLNFMGRVTRFELATFGTTNRRSNQLSYTRHTVCTIVVLLLSLCPPSPRLRWTLKFLNRALCAITKFRGGADQTRTDDPLHAMQVLYQLSYNPVRKLILYFFLPKVKSFC